MVKQNHADDTGSPTGIRRAHLNTSAMLPETVTRPLHTTLCYIRSNLNPLTVVAALATVTAGVGVDTVRSFASPTLLAFTLPSLLPALMLLLYIRECNSGWNGPPATASTYALGVAAAGAAYLANTAAVDPITSLPVIGGMTLFFFVFVAPVEEALKLAAVHLYSHNRTKSFTAMDGMYMGAVAALGFITVENALYVFTDGLLGDSGVVESIVGRANVGVLHVFWTAIAGYYLGVARQTGDLRPALYGAVLATSSHAVYNSFVWYQTELASRVASTSVLSVDIVASTTTMVFLLALYGSLWYSLEKLTQRSKPQQTLTNP